MADCSDDILLSWELGSTLPHHAAAAVYRWCVKMVLRFLMRYLANNEQLVNRLAESYPIRRAAQWTIYLFSRTKAISANPQARDKLLSEFTQIVQRILKSRNAK